MLYDTGIRLSELCGLRTGDVDRKHGLIIVKGKGSKERRIALGQNCLRQLLYYLEFANPVLPLLRPEERIPSDTAGDAPPRVD